MSDWRQAVRRWRSKRHQGRELEPSRLVLARFSRGLSRRHVAASINVPLSVYRDYEDLHATERQRHPNKAKVMRLALLLHYPIDFFYAEKVEIVEPVSWVCGTQSMNAEIERILEVQP